MTNVEKKRLAVRVEDDIRRLAIHSIADAQNPYSVYNATIAKAIITELDQMVESGEIEEWVYTLDEILMVIGWIEG